MQHGVRVHVRYDGTDLHGWQRQPGFRTAQAAIEDALDAMVGPGAHTKVRGASRTDSGVHAEGQVAAFDVDRLIPPRGWVLGLGGVLPRDVTIARAEPVAVGYNPRFDTRQKTYRYSIYTGDARHPLLERTAWYIGPALARKDVRSRSEWAGSYLDLNKMRAAARTLEGEHDFHAFRAVNDERKTTVRTLFAVRVLEDAVRPDVLNIEVTGTAFMKNMVRILAGTLVDVGRGRYTPQSVAEMLAPGASRQDTGPTAPAQGLTLVSMLLGRQG